MTAGLHRAGLTTIGNFSVRPTVEESEGTSGIFSRIATEMTGITGAIGLRLEIWQGKLKKVENLEMSTVGRGIWQEK